MLRDSNWDDFGFKTLFQAELYLADGAMIELGGVKILREGQLSGATEMPGRKFSNLGIDYCSLGQDTEYYELLSKLPVSVRESYLRSIRDAAFDQDIRRGFMNMDGWTTSLTRFGQALHALEVGKELTQGVKRNVGVATFEYVGSSPSGSTVEFSFNDTTDLPGRSNVVIGYNGVGKTHLLADIARAASERGGVHGSVGALIGEDSTFSAVIAISYSAFDNFELPQDKTQGQSDDYFAEESARTEVFGYVYCGLRRVDLSSQGASSDSRNELKSLDELDQELLNAFEIARHRTVGQERILEECLRLLEKEPSFGRIGIIPSEWLQLGADPRLEIQKLSTGHKIVLNIVVQLAAHLKPRSIVLLDEPETHLHPPLLAAMLRVLQRLLDAYDSFVIIATHSPVVLQEVPASSVRVLTRFGDLSDIGAPELETFGANVGSITRHVFSLDSAATDYQGILADIARRLSLDEIERLFPLGMSDQARALVLRVKRNLT
ncbi:AAA family ATPase [Plantibacter sp. M259]|uniref:AAA family ATPase n=1 Tax=Plantibacter sp. M259 TaxID=2583822 RepID=UPI00143CE197|nr:AAA family ATPase [Plantibacter sp. M259]